MLLILILDPYPQVPHLILTLLNNFLNIKEPLLDNILHKHLQMIFQDHFKIIKLANKPVIILFHTHHLNLFVLQLFLQK